MEPTSQNKKTKSTAKNEATKIPATSAILSDGSIVELVFDKEKDRTRFVVGRDGTWVFEDAIKDEGMVLTPYSARNNLLQHGVILFAQEPTDYDSDASLISNIEAYLNRYIDLEDHFRSIAAHYVLLSWVYDRFNELPYLRVRGDFGTGKTRFLITLGSLMYKPIFASGASTVSPIFHMLDRFRGTLILDEADFRFSDETAEMVKILNNGNVRGFPILRTVVNEKREFNPRAFNVFGPKLIATRGYYEDQALESRFITEEMYPGPVPKDIPVNLPKDQKEEAQVLQNKLLCYRIRNYAAIAALTASADATIEGRINQIVLPLLSVSTSESVRRSFLTFAQSRNQDLKTERGMTIQAHVLDVIRILMQKDTKGTIKLKDITALFCRRYGREYDERITNRWIGAILRTQLLLKPRKSNGNYVLSTEEMPKLRALFNRFGIVDVRAKGRDIGSGDEELTWEPVVPGAGNDQESSTTTTIDF